MENKNENKQIDLFDILIILAKRKWFIIIFTTLVSIIAVTYSLLATQYWTSRATFLPYQQESSFSFNSSSLAGLGSSLLAGGGSDSVELITVMLSRTFSENVIKEFDLVSYFEIEEKTEQAELDVAVSLLKELVLKIEQSDESGMVSISVKTKNSQLSADIANYYLDNISFYGAKNRMSKGKEQRIFIEKRLTQVEEEVKKLKQKIEKFQEVNNTIELEEQVKSTISFYSLLIEQKQKIDMEIDYLSSFNLIESAEYESKVNSRKLLIEKINDLENVSENEDYKYVLKFDEIPKLYLSYEQMKFEMQIYTKIIEYLYPQLESAKLQELKDTPSIEVVDMAIPAGRRSEPKRAKICIIMFIVAILISSSIVIFSSRITEVQKEKYQVLLKYLKK